MASRPLQRDSMMIAQPPAGTRLAVVLALSMLPMIVSAEETPPPTHPWKLAYARRIAKEGMEGREERSEFYKRAVREWRKAERARAKGTGLRARPVVPDVSATNGTEAVPLRRLPRPLGATTFTPPANTIVNDRTGDSGAACQSETSIAAF